MDVTYQLPFPLLGLSKFSFLLSTAGFFLFWRLRFLSLANGEKHWKTIKGQDHGKLYLFFNHRRGMGTCPSSRWKEACTANPKPGVPSETAKLDRLDLSFACWCLPPPPPVSANEVWLGTSFAVLEVVRLGWVPPSPHYGDCTHTSLWARPVLVDGWLHGWCGWVGSPLEHWLTGTYSQWP